MLQKQLEGFQQKSDIKLKRDHLEMQCTKGWSEIGKKIGKGRQGRPLVMSWTVPMNKAMQGNSENLFSLIILLQSSLLEVLLKYFTFQTGHFLTMVSFLQECLQIWQQIFKEVQKDLTSHCVNITWWSEEWQFVNKQVPPGFTHKSKRLFQVLEGNVFLLFSLLNFGAANYRMAMFTLLSLRSHTWYKED